MSRPNEPFLPFPADTPAAPRGFGRRAPGAGAPHGSPPRTGGAAPDGAPAGGAPPGPVPFGPVPFGHAPAGHVSNGRGTPHPDAAAADPPAAAPPVRAPDLADAPRAAATAAPETYDPPPLPPRYTPEAAAQSQRGSARRGSARRVIVLLFLVVGVSAAYVSYASGARMPDCDSPQTIDTLREAAGEILARGNVAARRIAFSEVADMEADEDGLGGCRAVLEADGEPAFNLVYRITRKTRLAIFDRYGIELLAATAI